MLLEKINLDDMLAKASRLAEALTASGAESVPMANAEGYEHTKQLMVHYQYGTDPGDKIRTHRPHEPDEIANYRIGTLYEQTTWGWARKLLEIYQSVLSNRSLYDFKFPDQFPTSFAGTAENNTIKDFLTENIKVPGNNFEKFFWQYLFVLMSFDPNGYNVVRPVVSDEAHNETNDQYRDVLPVFIPSTHIVDEDAYGVMVLSSDLVLVTDAEGLDYHYPVFFYFTESLTTRTYPARVELIEQEEGEAVAQIIYESEAYHHHGKKIAARKAGGLVSPRTGLVMTEKIKFDLLYLSIFTPTIADFNRALSYQSDLEAMLVQALHPIRQTEPESCPSCKGKGQNENIKSGEIQTCQTCQGSGKSQEASSAFTSLNKKSNKDGIMNPAMLWITPPTDIFKHAEDTIQNAIKDAFCKMNQEMLFNKLVGVQQTAREKDLDHATQHKGFKNGGEVYYPAMQWYVDMINALMYSGLDEDGTKANRVIVRPPITFDLTTTKEIMQEIEQAQVVSIPAAVRARLAIEAISRRYGDKSNNALYQIAIIEIDPFRMLSEDEIAAMQSRPLEADLFQLKDFIHNNVYEIVEQLIAADSNFLNESGNDKRIKAETLGKKLFETAMSEVSKKAIDTPVAFQQVEK